MSGSLGEREMLQEHELQASVSTAFSNLANTATKRKKNNLFTLIIKM